MPGQNNVIWLFPSFVISRSSYGRCIEKGPKGKWSKRLCSRAPTHTHTHSLSLLRPFTIHTHTHTHTHTPTHPHTHTHTHLDHSLATQLSWVLSLRERRINIMNVTLRATMPIFSERQFQKLSCSKFKRSLSIKKWKVRQTCSLVLFKEINKKKTREKSTKSIFN